MNSMPCLFICAETEDQSEGVVSGCPSDWSGCESYI